MPIKATRFVPTQRGNVEGIWTHDANRGTSSEDMLDTSLRDPTSGGDATIPMGTVHVMTCEELDTHDYSPSDAES